MTIGSFHNYDKIKETLQRLRSYEKTAKLVGLSKQRIHQIAQEHFPELYEELRKKPKKCDRCGEVKRYTTKFLAGQLCRDCSPVAVKEFKEAHWSYHHDKCVRCGRTEIAHHSHGYCHSCVWWHRYTNNEEYRKQHYINTLKWREKNPEKYKEIQRKASRTYMAKVMADPVLHEAMKAKYKANYQKRSSKYISRKTIQSNIME